MELLWSEGRALTRAEIIDLSPNKSWKPSAIHILLNSLLKKEAIKVEGFKPTGKNYGRTYAATLTPGEHLDEIMNMQCPKELERPVGMAMKSMFSNIVEDRAIDDKTLDELQEILDRKRKELKK